MTPLSALSTTLGVLLLGGGVAWFQITQPLLRAAAGGNAPPLDSGSLRAEVETICRDYFPRSARYPVNLRRLADHIESRFAEAQARVRRQTFVVDGSRYYNVIASFGPDTPERIVVGAHYDTAGVQPGADDNASGVAGLLALAGLLQDARLGLRVELAAYALEEPPYFRSQHMGSAAHVRLLQEQGAQVRMMLALEMIGYFADAPGSQDLPSPALRWFYPDRGNFIAVVGRFFGGAGVRAVKRAMRGASDLPVYSLNAPAVIPGVDFSDHLSFWQAGYPAAMVTDTAFYRYDGYHSPRDTPDRLDYVRMGKVLQGVFAAVLQLAGAGGG